MNPIDPYATSMAAGPHETGGAIGLADRVLAQRRMNVPTEPTIKSTQDNLIPLPEPVSPMDKLVSDWAMLIFKEMLVFGEEEETGNPPLTIDI
ncbi:hypothetical protein H9654_10195 [Stenotrophomonas sp. Sa5BUN4]|uniref:Uncharacterized protein n=1 Tax=Stenotrophomonas lacuserhaii TaxID=2760084 RepID=A0A8X8FMC1_9GAMM|nr:hypothetical protein [Stenotrophomonas pennii]MBD7954568.1 hypothetical protein [Stenotrophomonas pennii]